MEELRVSLEVASTRLHPCKELVVQDRNTLLLGGGGFHLFPYRRHLCFRGNAADKAELKPIQRGDHPCCGLQGRKQGFCD